MQIGKANLLKCPFCGASKEVLNLVSGNNFGMKMWSDTKIEYPMLPTLSPIQKCPKCNSFFFLHQAECSIGDNETLTTGKLSLSDAIQAFQQLGGKVSGEDKRILYLVVLFAYNDMFREYPECATEEESAMGIIREVMEGLLTFDNAEPIMKGELLRELGRFDEAIELLEKIREDRPDMNWVTDKIIEHAKKQDKRVFLIE